MARYTMAQAQAQLPDLVGAAERGDEVVIDQPDADIVVKLVAHRIRPKGPNDVEWLDAVRVRPRRGKVNTTQLLEEAKAEGWR
jgi:antitoxin (DNA-binding transcriptional repressor) of toxin-antitoxin stability system